MQNLRNNSQWSLSEPLTKSEDSIHLPDKTGDSNDELVKSLAEDIGCEVELIKGLFYEPGKGNVLREAEPDKNSVFWELQCAVDNMKRMKDVAWLVEDDLPEAKEVFKSKYAAEVSKAKSLLKKYKSLKKSEEEVLNDVKARLLKAKDELQKSSMANRNQEATKAELEKIGGGAGIPGSVQTTGGPSIGSQIGFPGVSKEDHEDEKEDKKLIDQKIKEHIDKKHTLKEHKKQHEKLGLNKGGQWSLGKFEGTEVNQTPIDEMDKE